MSSEHSTASPTPVPTWQELIEREPRLLGLETWCGTQPTCGIEFERSYVAMKRQLSRLVGHYVDDPLIGTHYAWEAGHRHLLQVLEGGR